MYNWKKYEIINYRFSESVINVRLSPVKTLMDWMVVAIFRPPYKSPEQEAFCIKVQENIQISKLKFIFKEIKVDFMVSLSSVGHTASF